MYIRKFQSISKQDVETAGGKGANLGEMTKAGIPVPPGSVLTAQAYERFVHENGIDVLKEPWKIRADIEAASMPEDVEAEILAFYQSMGKDVRVAVRSSATAEDLADASFAGQQETYLNVQGGEQLLSCIKSCYASLWGDRAVSYRRENGYGDQTVALAVVIQKMVNSDAAGVLFTKNPADMGKDEMVINASYGLGESVVSGAVSPDELLCTRDGQIRKQVIGSKESMVIYGAERTVTVSVEEEKRRKLSIAPTQVKRLVEEGNKIEAHYRMPMDIEWAYAGDELYILQARPITTESAKTVSEADLPPIRPVNKKMKESLLFMLEKEPFTYYPLDYDFSMILGWQKAVIFAEGGIKIDNECGMDENGFMTLPTEKFGLGKNIRRLPSILRSMNDHQENIRRAKLSLKAAKPEIERLAKKDFSDAKMEDCLQALTDLHDLITDTAYARFRYAVFPGFLMNGKLEKYLKKVDKNLAAYDLLSGLPYKTADMNRDMTALADRILEEDSIKEAVLSRKSYEEITKQFPKAGEWVDSFLEKYGFKSDFPCYCFIAQSWNEDKERFLQVLRPLLSAQSGREMTMDAGETAHKELLGKMTALLKAGEAEKLEKLVESYRFYHVFREETQYLWETAFYACRKVLMRTAGLFGVRQEELLYLFWEELKAAMKRGALDAENREKIGRRQKLRPVAEEYWKRQQWEALKGDRGGIRGISGSAGQATGEVCVVTSTAEFGKLKKGDILVCRYTDPEWTPLFTLAAAVVSDTGGALSHAAIVAREYHIPAVLATGCATTQLKDGERVLVNGSAGEVVRL